MRWLCVLTLLVAGCGPSVWERHSAHLAEEETQGQYGQAAAEQQWMIDNAFVHAPADQQTPKAEATRYLHLASLAAKAGNTRLAVEALREALTIDPLQAPAIRRQLEQLPVSPAEHARLEREFAWNATALEPSNDATPEEAGRTPECWSYKALEIRIRQRQTLRTPDGMEQRVSYDARTWRFDATSGDWRPQGGWRNDVAVETEMVDGPEQPRYRAVVAADGGFFVDGKVPACQQADWHGPYDPQGTCFVAAHLAPAHPVDPAKTP